MLKNENIICISSIDWDFIWQGHQEIMSTLAENGNRVLFIENTGVRAPGIRDIPRIRKRIKNWLRGIKGIRRESENLYVFSPLILPFPYSRIARMINRRLVLGVLEKWIKVMDFADPVVWTFLPTPLTLDILDSIDKKLTVYYCIDDFSVSSVSASKIKRPETELLKRADLVFVTSKALRAKCAAHNSAVYTFPFAVNFNQFEKIRLTDSPAIEELKDVKRPIIGYVGGVHKWINQELVKSAADKLPHYSFVFVGPVQTDTSLLSGLGNVHFLGSRNHALIPQYIKYFDTCMIPYRLTAYTNNVYPTKLNEYLAMGKAVLSTKLPEVVEFNKEHKDIVSISEDGEGFIKNIEKSVSGDNEELAGERIKTARENSWENRVEKMCGLIEKAIHSKRLDNGIKWKENIFAFYKKAKKRGTRLVLSLLLFYLLLFQTPLVWFLAGPLKVENPPKPADAIVVFAGGVGESGRAGQGYEERVQYAVELYRRGLGQRMIFSTGYKYALEEARVMKALAVSQGIPPEAIILEEKAKNTYENVKFTNFILDKYRLDSVLLVSSPYHMKRAKLVFDKVAGDKDVTYAPIPHSLFYEHAGGARPHQIGGIIHECMAIVYYFYKGYI